MIGWVFAALVGVVGAAEFREAYPEFDGLDLPSGVYARLERQAESKAWARWMRHWNETLEDPPVERDCAADLDDSTYYRRRLLARALTITSWGDPAGPPPAWALRNFGLMLGLAMHHGSSYDLATMDALLAEWITALEERPPGIDVDRFLRERAQLDRFVMWINGLGPLGRAIDFDPGLRAN